VITVFGESGLAPDDDITSSICIIIRYEKLF